MSDDLSDGIIEPDGEDIDYLHSPYDDNNDSSHVEISRIKNLEDEQELLTSSLLALTSHFAQVQFRLRQIVDAPHEERDLLLQNLEEFAFRGIPEINQLQELGITGNLLNLMEHQRYRQHELIKQLKSQLEDLEKYAYESGEIVMPPPQSIMVEKQKIIIDELKNKLNLNLDEINLPQLTTENLRNQVDTAIGEFVNPFKMKEQLVSQLKTQIIDLERFITFLQGETTNDIKLIKKQKQKKTINNCQCINTKKLNEKKIKGRRHNDDDDDAVYDDNELTDPPSDQSSDINNSKKTTTDENDEKLNNKAFTLMSKASTLLQIFAVTQFGCGGSARFQRNTLKKTTKGNHWGDIRAQLEVDIQEVLSLVQQLNLSMEHDNDDDDDDLTAISTSTTSSSSSPNTSSTSNKQIIKKQNNIVHDYNYIKNNGIIKTAIMQTATTQTQQQQQQQQQHEQNQYQASTKKLNKLNRTIITTSAATTTDKLLMTNLELTSVVRKNFAITLKKLIQHGLRSGNDTNSLVPFIGCFTHQNHLINNHHNHHQYNGSGGGGNNIGSNNDNCNNQYDDDDYIDNNKYGQRDMHAWELIIEYYHIKNGDKYNETPARKLSQSFNLDIQGGGGGCGGGAVSNKQSLLSTIGTIIAIHSPYKRSYNTHFKAFVCAGLNSQKLIQWLHLIFQSNELVATYYTSWSYVARTEFRDALKSMDKLTKYKFDLPVDLAVRQFQNIKDVFM